MQNRIAIIRNGRIVYGRKSTVLKPHETAARERRESMKTKHRKDLLQKNETDYYKVHPEQAKNLNDETRRLLS